MDKIAHAHVPAFDGKGSSFLDYEQRVISWNRTTDIHPDKRASLLVLHMDPIARQVCLHSGGDAFMDGVDVTSILQILKHYFLPDATDQVFQDVQRFLLYKRTDQPMERFILD